jgi:hypothetical protein
MRLMLSGSGMSLSNQILNKKQLFNHVTQKEEHCNRMDIKKQHSKTYNTNNM